MLGIVGAGSVSRDVRPKSMSPRPKYNEEDFPAPGTVFVAPMDDGRFSSGRVLRRQFQGGAQAALITASPWIGSEPPPLDLPELKETLVLSHHNWKDRREFVWVW